MDYLIAFWFVVLLGSIVGAIVVGRRTHTLLLLLGFITPWVIGVAYWALEECFAGINTSETCTWGFVLLPLYALVATAVGACVYLVWMSAVRMFRWMTGIRNKQV